MQKHISVVISVWEHWMIFPKYYTDQLTEIFLKKDNVAQSDASISPVDSAPATIEEGVEGVAYQDEVDGEPMDNDVDGEPMDDDVDGVPMDDDVDGEPMDDDVDGEPMDDNIDGEPFEQEAQNKQETEGLYTEVEDMFS